MKKTSRKRAGSRKKPARKKPAKGAARSRRKPRKNPPSPRAPGGTPPPPPDPHAWRLVDRDQLAEILGVHPDTLSDYTREGMPVVDRGGRGTKSVYDLVACAAWWRINKTELNAMAAAQARNLDAAAEFNELKVAEKKGELISRDQVVREGQSYTKAFAAKVRGLSRQLQLAGVITRDQEIGVTAACRELLVEIASWRTVADTDVAAASSEVPAA